MERTTALLNSIRKIEPGIAAFANDARFHDVNYFGPDRETLVRPVAEMMIPSKCRNKCGLVSEAIVNSNFPQEFVPNLQVKVAGIETPAGNHYAILVEDENDGVIIDFTARQFDPNVSFPVIMDMWDWQSWTEERIGRIGVWSHDRAY